MAGEQRFRVVKGGNKKISTYTEALEWQKKKKEWLGDRRRELSEQRPARGG
jgi:hypothetical protein